jgi:SAM-dependent methyltransferase
VYYLPATVSKEALIERHNYEKHIWALDRFRILKSYKLLKEEKVGRIIDIGCMGGQSMVPLLKEGWDCFGVEISDAYLIACDRGIKCVQHDVNTGLPFNDGFFDAIWAEEVIEHLFDTDLFLKECFRVLKSGGVFIVSTPNLASLINRVRLLFGFYPRYVQYNNVGHGHLRYYTSATLKKQVSSLFCIEKIVGNFVSFPDPTSNKFFRRLFLAPLGTYLPNLSENIIAKARKT